jgi:hypothetical protein
MSETYLILIPTDPTWQPEAEAAQRAGNVVDELVPEADEVEAFGMDEVEFFDSGDNFASAKCPHCGTDVTEWWPEAMDRASEVSFGDLGVTMPCCGRPASLNDLVYDMPQGFAQFAISVTEPGIEELGDAALRRIGEALGHPVRAIWQLVGPD